MLMKPLQADLKQFSIRMDRGQPLFLQIAEHVATAIQQESIVTGTCLPSERDLARSLQVSRSTVTDAYRELESRGLIRSHVGCGAYVCATSTSDAPFAWHGKLSATTALLDDPILEVLMEDNPTSSKVSFTAGMPPLECFPRQAFQASMERTLRDHAHIALGVSPTAGVMALRSAIAARLKTEPQRVLILAGAQQGIDLIARCFIDPGDHVIVERPCYPGVIQSLRAAGAVLCGWDTPKWDMSELETLLLRHRPKLIFVNPTCHNPTGFTMPVGQRIKLLELASRYRVPIIEDDLHRETYLDGAPPPSLYSLDEHNLVITLNTFSKVLAPGIRVGWLVASPFLVKQLAMLKMRAVLFTDGLMQLVLADLLRQGIFDEHLVELRAEHKRRLTAMLLSLKRHAPPGCMSWNQPSGGLYVWCKLHKRLVDEDFIGVADEAGVSFAPGAIFLPEKRDDSHFRLCFSASTPDAIERGVKNLARSLSADAN